MSKRSKKKDSSIALLCSCDGLITQVLHDGLGLPEPLVPGVAFSEILKPGSVEKGRKFLKAVETKGVFDGCQMDIVANGGTSRLYFTGVLEGDRFAIVGVPDEMPVAVTSLLGELLAGRNSEDIAEIAVRALLNEKREQDRDLDYRQLIRLNQDLLSAQRDLTRKNVELARGMEANALLLRAATHDLRQPVGTILVYSELLIEEALSTMGEESLEFIKAIHASTEFMLRLLDDVVDFSADEAGLPQLLESASLVQIVRQSVSFSRPLAEQKQTKLVLRHKGQLPTVKADALKLAKVFNSLIECAVQYSETNAEIEVQVAQKHKTALVSVRTDGPGIPPDELPDFFVPFQKRRMRITAGEPSTGLGLAIAKRIVEWHGGQIEVKIGDGKTVAFHVSLPSDPEFPTPPAANILQPVEL